jgi:hypothetical protein
LRKNGNTSFFSLFERQNMTHYVHNWWKKYVILNTVCVKRHTALLQFSFPSVTFASTLQLFLIFFGT